MYRHICVAVDGSDSSFKAVQSAAQLAASIGAQLSVLHVIRNMKVPDQLRRFVKQNSLERLREQALQEAGQEIVNHALTLAAERGVEGVQGKILSGDPAATLVATAEQLQGDLLVVGTRGLGQVEGVLIGSISNKLASISNISVLVVK